MAERGECKASSPIAVLVLGLLAERPMHPYEMFQLSVVRREDRLAKIRPGTMYHQVDRLAAQGLIEIHDVRREGNRPERTVYAITEFGREQLTASLETILARHPQEFPELYLALSEAHGLPRARVVELLGERVGLMRAEVAEYEAAAQAARSAGTDEMFYLDVDCKLVTLRTQIAWVENLIERLVSGRITWLDDPDFTPVVCSPSGSDDRDGDNKSCDNKSRDNQSGHDHDSDNDVDITTTVSRSSSGTTGLAPFVEPQPRTVAPSHSAQKENL